MVGTEVRASALLPQEGAPGDKSAKKVAFGAERVQTGGIADEPAIAPHAATKLLRYPLIGT